MPASLSPEKNRNILVLLFKSIGDTLLATPCFKALKLWNPGCRVTVLAYEGAAPILEGNPNVDRILRLRRGDSALARFRGKVAVSWELLRSRFDLVVNVHGGSTSALFTLFTRAPRRAGFRSFRFRWAYNLLAPPAPEILGKIDVHTVENLLALFLWLGIPMPDPPKPELAIDRESLMRVRSWLSRAGAGPEAPLAVIHPTATLETKRWPASRFAVVAEHLAERYGLLPVFTAGPQEAHVLAEVRSLCRSAALYSNEFTLKELAALISLAALYVGNDSGPTHMAAALEKPVVAVFGSSSRVHWSPWRTSSRVVGAELPCIPCPGYACYNPEKTACLEKVGVESVIAAIDDLMKSLRRGPRPSGVEEAHPFVSEIGVANFAPGGLRPPPGKCEALSESGGPTGFANGASTEKRVKSPAVFVDRDGTIIEDVGYLSDPGRIRFIEGAEETIRRLRGAGFKVICVSNQSGVARGFFTEQKVREIHERLQALLRAGGAELDAIYYCPHHPDFGNDFYRKVCECRKPAIGMLKQAEAEHAIDMGKSFLVGDSPADILAGKEAGVKTILVKSGREENEKSTGEGEQEARPDFNAGTLLEAAKIILGEK